MAFNTEEEADEWYNSEKEKLDLEFSERIQKDPKNIPSHRAKYQESLRKTISRYQLESERLVEKENAKRRNNK